MAGEDLGAVSLIFTVKENTVLAGERQVAKEKDSLRLESGLDALTQAGDIAAL